MLGSATKIPPSNKLLATLGVTTGGRVETQARSSLSINAPPPSRSATADSPAPLPLTHFKSLAGFAPPPTATPSAASASSPATELSSRSRAPEALSLTPDYFQNLRVKPRWFMAL